ncbi:MAG TPA: hypothetical protein VKQ72_19555, partial [Aggregatilineales bacterium]|nr:hypothetical protein [Aggregatilineales bacterium]
MNMLGALRRHSLKWMVAPLLLLALLAATLGSSAQSAKTLTIGVIGSNDSSTMRGVELAISRFSTQGNLIAPDGSAYKLDATAQNATTADDVTKAIGTFTQNNVVAVFGPDDDSLALASANVMGMAGVPVFTASQNQALTLVTSMFRTRVRDSRQLDDLADTLVKSLSKSQFSIFQADSIAADRAKLFIGSLARLGKESAAPVSPSSSGAQSTEGTTHADATSAVTQPSPATETPQLSSMADAAKALLATKPDAVV